MRREVRWLLAVLLAVTRNDQWLAVWRQLESVYSCADAQKQMIWVSCARCLAGMCLVQADPGTRAQTVVCR